MPTDPIATVLVQHPSIEAHMGTGDWCCPTCGVPLNGGPNSPPRAAHQAEALRAAGLAPTETEWVVRCEPDGQLGDIFTFEDDARAALARFDDDEDHRHTLLVSRRTAWVPADEGSKP